MSFRALFAFAIAASLALALIACGGDDGTSDDGASDDSAPQTAGFSAEDVDASFDANVQPVVVNSSLGVGPSRFSIGIFRADNSLLLGAAVTAQIYRLDDADQGTFVGEYPMRAVSVATDAIHQHADGTVHVHEDAFATLYIADIDFDSEGFWGAAFDVETPDGETFDGVKAAKFFVQADTPEPSLGDPMPRSVTLTLDDVDDISDIDSSADPIPALHELTVAQALDTGEPVVVAIATPAFCQTRFCGPVLSQVVVPLYERFGDVAKFVHVEPYDLAQARAGRLEPVPLMEEWQLRTEPWIFIAGRDGNIVAKFEGLASLEEVETALMHAIETNPDK